MNLFYIFLSLLTRSVLLALHMWASFAFLIRLQIIIHILEYDLTIIYVGSWLFSSLINGGKVDKEKLVGI